MLHANQQFAISSGELYAELSPSMGGRLLKFAAIDGPDILIATEPQTFDAVSWPRGGAYPLVPYHNRIANGQIAVGGQCIQLPPHPAAAPHTLHGPGHTRPWELVEHTSSRIVTRLDYPGDEHWPWQFEAVQDFAIAGNVLTVGLSLKNLDDRPMPGGLGWHPYFASVEQVITDAKYRWPHGDDYLPLGNRVGITDRQSTKYLPTQYLQGWSTARVACSQGYEASITATSRFTCLVIHRGDPLHICVEPVTHVANAWNLEEAPEAVGALILSPGETIGGAIQIEVTRKD